jgi:hypothetical protein
VAAVDQGRLIDLPASTPPEADAEERPERRSSKGIAPGDIVRVDRKGRRFLAHVVAVDQRESGRFELELRPIERGITYRQASVREVVDVWRKVRRA